MLLEQPFFGSLCMRLTLVPDRKCQTVWTDGDVFAYNPNFVEVLPHEKLMGVVAHTVMHPACQHHKRRGDRDPKLWNVACDYAINWILIEAGLSLPDSFLDSYEYRGKSADEIYSRLTNLGESEGVLGGNNTEGPEKGEEVDAAGSAGAQRSGEEDDDQQENSSENGEVAPAENGDDGAADSGESGESLEDQPEGEDGDPGECGEVRDGSGDGSSSPEGGDEADENWQVALAQAAHKAREMGDLPAGLERLVAEVLDPPLPWNDLLEMFINANARNDYSWIPPNRRHLHAGVYLPSLFHQELPDVVVGVDTSGSVTADDLNSFASEISAILEQFDTQVHVVWFDSEVSDTQVLSRAELPLELKPKGGGGTDFRPFFTWVEEEMMTPACLVVFTDMECNRFPENEPMTPVLWVRTGGGGDVPPFGQVVDMV